MGVQHHYFACGYLVFLGPFPENTIISPMNLLSTLVKNQLTHSFDYCHPIITPYGQESYNIPSVKIHFMAQCLLNSSLDLRVRYVQMEAYFCWYEALTHFLYSSFALVFFLIMSLFLFPVCPFPSWLLYISPSCLFLPFSFILSMYIYFWWGMKEK